MPETELINEINEKARFERIAGKRKAPVADAEIDRFLDEHFAEHKLLQRHHIEDYFALSKRRALTILNSLVADGRLRRTPGTTACTASYVRG